MYIKKICTINKKKDLGAITHLLSMPYICYYSRLLLYICNMHDFKFNIKYNIPWAGKDSSHW